MTRVLVIPPVGGRHPDWTLDVALAHVEQAAGGPVETLECGERTRLERGMRKVRWDDGP